MLPIPKVMLRQNRPRQIMKRPKLKLRRMTKLLIRMSRMSAADIKLMIGNRGYVGSILCKTGGEGGGRRRQPIFQPPTLLCRVEWARAQNVDERRAAINAG